jgi:hypothetical protein
MPCRIRSQMVPGRAAVSGRDRDRTLLCPFGTTRYDARIIRMELRLNSNDAGASRRIPVSM